MAFIFHSGYWVNWQLVLCLPMVSYGLQRYPLIMDQAPLRVVGLVLSKIYGRGGAEAEP